MDTYVTGITIKNLREKKGLTQTELADILGVSSKAISKWETAKGLPDISLIEPLANALSVSSSRVCCNRYIERRCHGKLIVFRHCLRDRILQTALCQKLSMQRRKYSVLWSYRD